MLPIEVVQAPTEPPPRPKRDWHAYNLGQTQEVRLFDSLLTDLTALIPTPPRPVGPGQPPTPPSLLAWCAIKKAHTGWGGRRNQGYIQDAHQEGLLDRLPGHNAAVTFLGQSYTESMLRPLVQVSALPFVGLEDTFAVDSTGFACGTYGSYRDARYGTVKAEEWVKLHACIGTRFKVITDAIVTDQRGGDSPRFEPLVRGTSRRFPIKEVYADKAYSSKTNLWTVTDLGGMPYIPFRSGKAAPNGGAHCSSFQGIPGKPGSGKTWRRLHHYFMTYPDEFYSHYHRRSSIEGMFAALKATLGERLKCRTMPGQANEVLCKAIAWNIRRTIAAMMEIGLEPKFL